MAEVLLHGDCLEVLKDIPDNSVDSIVTDPPYGLSFMGKQWDYDVPTTEIWAECLRVLKPGGHLLAFFGTRTYHRGVVRIEDAGFEIRDQIMWIYGSGFPKSHDVSKGIDKQAGVERLKIMVPTKPGNHPDQAGDIALGASGMTDISTPVTDAAKQWQGWGTALKPANEPIVVARKPLEKGLTIAENVMKWGTGALNIDASRIGTGTLKPVRIATSSLPSNGKYGEGLNGSAAVEDSTQGRWPANIIFDEEAAAVLDEQSGTLSKPGNTKPANISAHQGFEGRSFAIKGRTADLQKGDTGGASRFFYVAKASKRERNAGLEGMPLKKMAFSDGANRAMEKGADEYCTETGGGMNRIKETQNFHPTVKPIKLMEYLITLVTPLNGSVLDPFMGSGSTGVAAKRLKRDFIGIEMNAEYLTIAERRVKSA